MVLLVLGSDLQLYSSCGRQNWICRHGGFI